VSPRLLTADMRETNLVVWWNAFSPLTAAMKHYPRMDPHRRTTPQVGGHYL
jgi:hypothetical protein